MIYAGLVVVLAIWATIIVLLCRMFSNVRDE
jgi:hypothetical protein